MEASIILEGCKKIEEKGARVISYIADQDASTFPTLQQYLVRNLTTYLENWIKNNKLQKF